MRSKDFQPHLKRKKKVYNLKKKCIIKKGVKFNFKNQSKKKKRNIQRKPMSKAKITLKNERKKERKK
jgi:hypothetical protein